LRAFISHHSFIATFEGDSATIPPGTESEVRIIFNPKFEGRFEATLELIFSHGQRSTRFSVFRRLGAIAGSLEDHKRFEFLDQEPYIRRTGTGRQVPPQKVIPLWPSDRPRKFRKLPEYELPRSVQAAMDNVTPKHPFDEEVPRLIDALRPGALDMDTYAQYFKALLNVEDAHQQWVWSPSPIVPDSDVGTGEIYWTNLPLRLTFNSGA
jgi:helicase MOV-10